MTDSILNHPLISQRYFFPRHIPFPHPHTPTWINVKEDRLACWSSISKNASPSSNRPILLHFHGNGEVVSDWIDFFKPLSDHLNMDILLAEYRGYGQSTGTPKLQQYLDDFYALFQYIDRPQDQIIVFGRSIGSLYALEWVNRFPNTRGLILESGIHDLKERLLLRVSYEELNCTAHDFNQEVDLHFNAQKILQNYPHPSLFLHAQQDHLVSLSHAQRNVNAAQKPQHFFFPQGDHNSILYANFDAYCHLLVSWIRNLI